MAAEDVYASYELVGRAGAAGIDGHEVNYFGNGIAAVEAGDEDVGVGPIELFGGDDVGGWGDGEAAAFVVVENGGEDTWRIEVREAEPID